MKKKRNKFIQARLYVISFVSYITLLILIIGLGYVSVPRGIANVVNKNVQYTGQSGPGTSTIQTENAIIVKTIQVDNKGNLQIILYLPTGNFDFQQKSISSQLFDSKGHGIKSQSKVLNDRYFVITASKVSTPISVQGILKSIQGSTPTPISSYFFEINPQAHQVSTVSSINLKNFNKIVAQNEIDFQANKVASTQAAISKSTAQIATLNDQISQLQNKKATLIDQQEISSIDNQVKNLQSQLQSAQSTLTDQESQLKGEITTVNQLKEQYSKEFGGR
jgi:hypothetical protein